MKNIQRSLLFFLGFAALISGQNLSHASDTPAPYIYYYANTINAIVVERADGKDSRIIAPGAMPANNMGIVDLDWSPSGKWMAWLSAEPIEGGMHSFSGWIVPSDGSERLTLLDKVAIITMKWSPSDDLLFVVHASASHGLEFSIIDPAANKIIAHTAYKTEDVGSWVDGFPSGWMADGKGIYFELRVQKVLLLGTLSISGEAETRIFESLTNQDAIFSINNGRVLGYEYRYNQEKTPLTMWDLSTGKRVLLDSRPLNELAEHPSWFQPYWDSSRRYALIFTWPCDSVSPCYYPRASQTQLYLLDWETGTLQFLAARVLSPLYNDDLISQQYSSDIWSPDGHYAAMLDTLHHLIIIDVHSGYLFPSIEVPPQVTGWQWAEQSDTLILFSKLGRQLYRYDLKQQTITPLDISIRPYSWFSLSPDGRFVGLINRYAGKNVPDMYDLKTEGKYRWPHHSLGSSAGPILNYLWHPDSRWFMTAEWSAFAGGGPGPSSVMVLNTDGTVRRELSVCVWMGTCAGFVPDRALPYLGEGSLQSVIPAPEYSLPHDGTVVAVAWSPDGSKIASYSLDTESTGSGSLNIWDVSGTPTLLTSRESKLDLGYIVLIGGRMIWDASGNTVRMNNTSEFKQYVWDANTGELLETRSIEGLDPVQMSPNGQLYYEQTDKTLSMINSETGKMVASIPVNNLDTIQGWSTDSRILFFQDERAFELWDGEKVRTLTMPFGFAFSIDANINSPVIVSAGYSHRVFVWDAVTGEPLPDLNFYARTLALSPDGKRLAAASSSLVTLWDVTDLSKKAP